MNRGLGTPRYVAPMGTEKIFPPTSFDFRSFTRPIDFSNTMDQGFRDE